MNIKFVCVVKDDASSTQGYLGHAKDELKSILGPVQQMI
jgi:hypothetical protein